MQKLIFNLSIALIALIFCLSSSAQSKETYAKYLYNFTEFETEPKAYLASINNNLVFLCGGALITPTYVITTAQCICKLEKEIKTKSLRVRVGISPLGSYAPDNVFKVNRVHCHPKFEPIKNPEHDIALLELKKSTSSVLHYNKTIGDNAPGFIQSYIPFNESCEYTDWHENSFAFPSKWIAMTSKLVVNSDACRAVYPPDFLSNVICAEVSRPNAQNFMDKGSPLHCSDGIVGVLTGAMFTKDITFAYFNPISNNLDFIKKIIPNGLVIDFKSTLGQNNLLKPKRVSQRKKKKGRTREMSTM